MGLAPAQQVRVEVGARPAPEPGLAVDGLGEVEEGTVVIAGEVPWKVADVKLEKLHITVKLTNSSIWIK